MAWQLSSSLQPDAWRYPCSLSQVKIAMGLRSMKAHVVNALGKESKLIRSPQNRGDAIGGASDTQAGRRSALRATEELRKLAGEPTGQAFAAVRSTTLTDLLRRHALTARPLHLLKIDCEGCEV